ncbi:MAG: cyclase family protein [Burkholderiales bacterium]
MTTNARWRRRPPGSNWGDFGPDDQLGRLNLVTPACVRAAAAEVREGVRFCLSLPLDLPGGNYHDLQRKPPALSPVVRNGREKRNLHANPRFTDVYSDEHVTLYTQFSTQWDALAHVGAMFDADGDGVPEVRHYNGFVGAPDVARIAETGLQARGVMVDLRRAFGDARRLVGYDDLMRTLDAQRVTVESGDVLCLHTGQSDVLLAQGAHPDKAALEDAFCHLDGCDERLLRWIDASNVAALAADNFAVEAVPPARTDDGMAYERLHELCLFKLGMPLGELWYLGELARWLADHGRTRFLLTAPPLRLPGAVGSPVTPVATV